MKRFKVLKPYLSNLKNYPNDMPWNLLNEDRAKKNHSQTLSRLNERGGMCVSEILHNLKDEPLSFSVHENQGMVDELNHIISKYSD